MISAGSPRSPKDKHLLLLWAHTARFLLADPRNGIAKSREFPLCSAAGRRIRKGGSVPGRRAGMKVLPSRSDVEAKSAPAREPAGAMIEIDRVSQIFRTSGRQDHLALSDISLTIEDGAFVSILGPSGCGKSTLLYIVGGFVNPTGGSAKVKGKTITAPGPDRGPVFQEFALFPWKTVLGNVMYGLIEQGVAKAA